MRGARRTLASGFLLIIKIDIGYSFFVNVLSVLRNRQVVGVRLCGTKCLADNSFRRPQRYSLLPFSIPGQRIPSLNTVKLEVFTRTRNPAGSGVSVSLRVSCTY